MGTFASELPFKYSKKLLTKNTDIVILLKAGGSWEEPPFLIFKI